MWKNVIKNFTVILNTLFSSIDIALNDRNIRDRYNKVVIKTMKGYAIAMDTIDLMESTKYSKSDIQSKEDKVYAEAREILEEVKKLTPYLRL